MLLKVDCAICQSSSLDGVSATSCGHVFHSSCLRTWLKKRSNCPSCRQSLKSSDIISKLFVKVIPSNQRTSQNAGNDSSLPFLLGVCFTVLCGTLFWKCEVPHGKTMSDLLSNLKHCRLLLVLDDAGLLTNYGNLVVFDKNNILYSGVKAFLSHL